MALFLNEGVCDGMRRRHRTSRGVVVKGVSEKEEEDITIKASGVLRMKISGTPDTYLLEEERAQERDYDIYSYDYLRLFTELPSNDLPSERRSQIYDEHDRYFYDHVDRQRSIIVPSMERSLCLKRNFRFWPRAAC